MELEAGLLGHLSNVPPFKGKQSSKRWQSHHLYAHDSLGPVCSMGLCEDRSCPFHRIWWFRCQRARWENHRLWTRTGSYHFLWTWTTQGSQLCDYTKISHNPFREEPIRPYLPETWSVQVVSRRMEGIWLGLSLVPAHLVLKNEQQWLPLHPVHLRHHRLTQGHCAWPWGHHCCSELDHEAHYGHSFEWCVLCCQWHWMGGRTQFYCLWASAQGRCHGALRGEAHLSQPWGTMGHHIKIQSEWAIHRTNCSAGDKEIRSIRRMGEEIQHFNSAISVDGRLEVWHPHLRVDPKTIKSAHQWQLLADLVRMDNFMQFQVTSYIQIQTWKCD